MSVILKLKTNDEIYWKTDSFWSLTKERKHAKIHFNEMSVKNLSGNLIYSLNSSLIKADDERKEKLINFYNNSKTGYDLVEGINWSEFKFIENGLYEYKLRYNSVKNEFELIDIKRKQKLEKLAELAK